MKIRLKERLLQKLSAARVAVRRLQATTHGAG